MHSGDPSEVFVEFHVFHVARSVLCRCRGACAGVLLAAMMVDCSDDIFEKDQCYVMRLYWNQLIGQSPYWPFSVRPTCITEASQSTCISVHTNVDIPPHGNTLRPQSIMTGLTLPQGASDSAIILVHQNSDSPRCGSVPPLSPCAVSASMCCTFDLIETTFPLWPECLLILAPL
jgi:hypothetical protein